MAAILFVAFGLATSSFQLQFTNLVSNFAASCHFYRYKLFNLFSVNAHVEARLQLDWVAGGRGSAASTMWVILVVVVVVVRVAAAAAAAFCVSCVTLTAGRSGKVAMA